MPSFVTVPTHVPGDTFPSADWNIVAANMNSGGLMRMLADTTLIAAAASIDFTSIPQTFAHLMLVLHGRGDAVSGTVNVLARLNNDSGANYYYERVGNLVAATVSAAESLTQTSLSPGFLPAASATAGIGGSMIVFIPGYATGTLSKALASLNACAGTSTGALFMNMFGGTWNSGVAVNRVTLLPASGNFVIGSRATLYGLPQ